MKISDNQHDGQLRAMALIASLRTAAEVCRTLTRRRAGEDPSEQEEPEPARQRLLEGRRILRDLVLQLRLSIVMEPAEAGALVRAFEDRLVLAHAARELHVAHQRLLSLYPEVEPELAERARIIQAEAARLAAAGVADFQPGVAAWCDATLGFADDLADALYTPN